MEEICRSHGPRGYKKLFRWFAIAEAWEENTECACHGSGRTEAQIVEIAQSEEQQIK